MTDIPTPNSTGSSTDIVTLGFEALIVALDRSVETLKVQCAEMGLKGDLENLETKITEAHRVLTYRDDTTTLQRRWMQEHEPSEDGRTDRTCLHSNHKPFIHHDRSAQISGLGKFQVGYELFGQVHRTGSARDVYIDVIKNFSELDDGFMNRFERVTRTQGRTRNYVGRSRTDVYPERPDLEIEELLPGWYIGTNENNRTKRKILRLACQTIGIEYGSDLKVKME